VGPGDPELLTLKAVRILRQAAVVYHAGPGEREGRAWQVIQGLLRPEQQIRALLTKPMRAVSAAEDVTPYRPAGERIAADCRRGLDVAFVTEGDPTLYSTAIPVWQLLREVAPEVAVEIVPGVTSVTAAAARVGWPLARKGEVLAVAPAGSHQDELHDLIDRFDTVCFLKAPQALPQLLTTLAAFGPTRKAVYVENLGTEREWFTQDPA